MNNFNDPKILNIPGNASLWDYGRLAALLALPVFRWIWKRESAREVLQQALEQENDWYYRANTTLKELEVQLMERQHIYCSLTQLRKHREEVEDNMLKMVSKEPISELNLMSDLKDILERDKHCAEHLNLDKRKNGNLMWVYLKHWQRQATAQQYKRAVEAVLGETMQSHSK